MIRFIQDRLFRRARRARCARRTRRQFLPQFPPRRKSRQLPTPIAGTDYVEIIKGPPPPVYGGGILNFIPKSAKSKTTKFIDKPVGVVSTTVGTYGEKIGSVEYGTPFSLGGKRSGAYVFVQAEDSKSYCDKIYNKDILAQLAIDTELSPNVLLEYGGMVQHANLNQSLGWNRVTQAMIDGDGTYLAGPRQAQPRHE